MEVDLTWMGLWNGAVEGQLLFKERAVGGAWRSGQKTLPLDMWANCVLKHCLSLKTFIANFIDFFVSLGFVISCTRKMSFSVGHFGKTGVYAGHCQNIHWYAKIEVEYSAEKPLFTDIKENNCISKYKLDNNTTHSVKRKFTPVIDFTTHIIPLPGVNIVH